MDNIKVFKNGKTRAYIDMDKKEIILFKTVKGFKR